MAKKALKVVDKTVFSFGGKTKKGTKVKSGVSLRLEDGSRRTLLTPSGKGTKYAEELRSGERRTNDGVVKTDEKGNVLKLSAAQRSYRSGYLDAQKDSAKAYKAKKSGGKK